MPPTTITVRLAIPADAAGCLAIYAPLVADTTTSFEFAVPSESAFAERIAATLAQRPWLVATDPHDTILGYAYAGPHRERAAYRWCVETSVYVGPAWRGHGLGRRLYELLFACLRAQGFCHAFAGITLPNAASVAFHRRLGFVEVGVYRQLGCKHGGWHSVGWWQKQLPDALPATPEPPRGSEAFAPVLRGGAGLPG